VTNQNHIQRKCESTLTSRNTLISHILFEDVNNKRYRGADKSLARPGRRQATATEDFEFHISYLFIIGGILILFIYTGVLISL
jgi:hypothetical protein